MRRRYIMTIFQYQEIRKIVYAVIIGGLVFFTMSFIKYTIVAILLAVVAAYFIEKWVEKRFPIPDQNSKAKVNTGIRLWRNVLITLGVFVFLWVTPIGSNGWWVIVAVFTLFLWKTIQETKRWQDYRSESSH